MTEDSGMVITVDQRLKELLEQPIESKPLFSEKHGGGFQDGVSRGVVVNGYFFPSVKECLLRTLGNIGGLAVISFNLCQKSLFKSVLQLRQYLLGANSVFRHFQNSDINETSGKGLQDD